MPSFPDYHMKSTEMGPIIDPGSDHDGLWSVSAGVTVSMESGHSSVFDMSFFNGDT
jgi:hypothetical protein